MRQKETALILIGYQNDYFAEDGILHQFIEESARVTGTLQNSKSLLDRLSDTEVTIISTPIVFTQTYEELQNPVGILKTIKDVGAFKHDTPGSQTVPQVRSFGSRILEVSGKRGLNAFSAPELNVILQERGIRSFVLAGAVTSICIDSTGRSAFDQGYEVTILSDCISARTQFEQQFYCEEVFPLYASVCTSHQLLSKLGLKEHHDVTSQKTELAAPETKSRGA